MKKRIQRKRTKGWRKPEGAVIVDRTSRWGNPYKVGIDGTRDECIALFRQHLEGNPRLVAEARTLLAGHDLACTCPLDKACHADTWIELLTK